MTIFFTSDTHFGHANIIKYSNRPFLSVEQMDNVMISNWNSMVKPQDEIYHLGDFAFSDPKRLSTIIHSLNGIKHLIVGNHDKDLDRNRNAWILKGAFKTISEMREFKVQDKDSVHGSQHIVLCHYSMRVWNKSHYDSWNLYGHSHGTLPDPENLLSLDVGVDNTAKRLGVCIENYRPISYHEVKSHMKTKTWKPIDHHRYGKGE